MPDFCEMMETLKKKFNKPKRFRLREAKKQIDNWIWLLGPDAEISYNVLTDQIIIEKGKSKLTSNDIFTR